MMNYLQCKRVADIVAAAVVLVGMSPLFALVAIAVRIDSPGPAVFRQTRVGRDGVPFQLFKFRTMSVAAPTEVPTAQMAEADSYITTVGGWLRRSSVDELPQVVNVLLGDMSFIGPRPVVPAEVRLTQLRCEAGVLRVRPGITGWAQVNGRDLVGVEAKVQLDREYVDNLSLRWDLRCLVRTVKAVLRREGVAEGNQMLAGISGAPPDTSGVGPSRRGRRPKPAVRGHEHRDTRRYR